MKRQMIIAGHQPKIYDLKSHGSKTRRGIIKEGFTGALETNQQQVVMRAPLKFLGRNQRKIEGDYAFTVDTNHTGGIRIIGGSQDHQTIRKDGNSPTLPSAMGMGGGHTPVLVDYIRRLTPMECERLQGFPDDWTKEVSDTQRYKCLGNAVTVPVVAEIARRLFA